MLIADVSLPQREDWKYNIIEKSFLNVIWP